MSQQFPEPEFDELYRELILDHYRNPRHHEPIETADVVADGYNPLCGDEIELRLDFDNGTIKDPSEWTTGEEPMTGAQESYLHTLARQAGEGVDDDLTKAEASQKIDELREKTGKENAAPARPKARKAKRR